MKSRNGVGLKAPVWTVKAKGRTSLHRQFALDCLARDSAHQKIEQTRNFEWWLQDYRAKKGSKAGPTAAQLNAFNKQLHKVPKGATAGAFGTANVGSLCANVDAKRFNVLNALLSPRIIRIIFNGISPTIIAGIPNT